MKKILIDSDVCLDVFLKRAPFVQHSSGILSKAEAGKFKGFVSSVAIANIFYVLAKNSSPKEASAKIYLLRSIVSIAGVGQKEIDEALKLNWIDFEDAIQYQAAVSISSNALITRNTEDYIKSDIPVSTPRKFLEDHS